MSTGDFFDDLEKQRKHQFWKDLNYAIKNQFWSDIQRAQWKELQITLAIETRRYKRRVKNIAKARRILGRLQMVQQFDIWKETAHIDPDFWGDNTERFERVKELYGKKNRIEWVLTALHTYWAFDVPSPGSEIRRGLSYSAQRKLYYELYDSLVESADEKRKEAKWAAKKERVKKRRLDAEKKKTLKVDKRKSDALETALRLRSSEIMLDAFDPSELGDVFSKDDPTVIIWGVEDL